MVIGLSFARERNLCCSCLQHSWSTSSGPTDCRRRTLHRSSAITCLSLSSGLSPTLLLIDDAVLSRHIALAYLPARHFVIWTYCCLCLMALTQTRRQQLHKLFECVSMPAGYCSSFQNWSSIRAPAPLLTHYRRIWADHSIHICAQNWSDLAAMSMVHQCTLLRRSPNGIRRPSQPSTWFADYLFTPRYLRHTCWVSKYLYIYCLFL